MLNVIRSTNNTGGSDRHGSLRRAYSAPCSGALALALESGAPSSQRIDHMARKYSKGSGRKVRRAMHEMKRGKLKSGRSGKKVKSRKQAIAIGLSEARRAGKKVPRKRK